MPNNSYRTIIHYHAKEGMEKKLISLNEKQLMNPSKSGVLYQKELWQDQSDPSHLIFSAVFKSEKEAKDFQPNLKEIKSQVMQFCNEDVHDDLQQIVQTYPSQSHQKDCYHVLVQCQAKPGMEQQLRSQTEQVIFNAAQKDTFHQAEVLQSPSSPNLITLSGTCKTLEDVKNFQLNWEAHKEELISFCSQEPHQETYYINKKYPDQTQKVA